VRIFGENGGLPKNLNKFNRLKVHNSWTDLVCPPISLEDSLNNLIIARIFN